MAMKYKSFPHLGMRTDLVSQALIADQAIDDLMCFLQQEARIHDR